MKGGAVNLAAARIGVAAWWLVPCVILLVYWPCLSGGHPRLDAAARLLAEIR